MRILAFLNDIKSKHLSTYVLVTISDRTIEEVTNLGACWIVPDDGELEIIPDITEQECESYSNNENTVDWFQVDTTIINSLVIHRISTQKVKLGGDYYKPVLLNIPSISESLDIESRKYKISSVSLSISDYEEDGVRFSDGLGTLINKEVNIYYATSSSQSLTYVGDNAGTTPETADVYLAGTYIIRSFAQDEDKVTLNCEDSSQDKLHKDLPFKSVSSELNILEKYHNKPVPMVFGRVDKSPCVATMNPSGTGELIIMADDIPSSTYIDLEDHDGLDGFIPDYVVNPLFIFRGNSYLAVLSSSSHITDSSGWGFQNEAQYYLPPSSTSDDSAQITVNVNVSPTTDDLSDVTKSPLSLDFAAVMTNEAAPRKSLITEDVTYTDSHENYEESFDTIIIHEAVEFGDEVTISAEGDASDSDMTDYTYKKYFEKHLFNALPDHVTGFNNNITYGKTRNLFIIDYSLSLRNFIGEEGTYRFDNLGIHNIDSWTMDAGASPVASSDHTVIDGGWAEGDSDQVQRANESQLSLTVSDFGASAQGRLIVDYLSRNIIYLIDKFHTSEFYIQVVGRGGETLDMQTAYAEILEELNFNGSSNFISSSELGAKYAFTLDRKINSKKLIEELSASSEYYPYFKDGNFNVKSIKSTYNGTNIIIKTDDVIKYKFDRTSINKVYTKVNVKYHYDYGLKEFMEETEDIFPENSGLNSNYSTDYFSEGFDQELVFESKYIREEPTASNFARYLCGLHANQHNLITLTLPLINYITLELGDVVKLDKSIQGRKMFGESYYGDSSIERNGQIIFPYFFIDRIKKNLDSVEVRLYQLHNIIADYGGEDVIEDVLGCMDSEALNYNPEATISDGSCEYEPEIEIITGCQDESALNSEIPQQDQEFDNSTCVYQADNTMIPPAIEEPEEGATIYTTEEITVIDGGGYEEVFLIDDPDNNSTFDNNTNTTTAYPEEIMLQYQIPAVDSAIVSTGSGISFNFDQSVAFDTFLDNYILNQDNLLASFFGKTIFNYTTGVSSACGIANILPDIMGIVSLVNPDPDFINTGDTILIFETYDFYAEDQFGFLLGVGANPPINTQYHHDWSVFNFSTDVDNPTFILGGQNTLQYFRLRCETETVLKLDIEEGWISGEEYKVSFKLRKLIGTMLRFSVYYGQFPSAWQWFPEGEDYPTDWYVFNETYTPSSTNASNNIKIKTVGTDSIILFEIDDVSVVRISGGGSTEISEWIDPTLVVKWFQSDSLGAIFDNLDDGGYPTIIEDGYYKVFISTLTEAGSPPTSFSTTWFGLRLLMKIQVPSSLKPPSEGGSGEYEMDEYQGATITFTDPEYASVTLTVGGAGVADNKMFLNCPSSGYDADWFLAMNGGVPTDGDLMAAGGGHEMIITFNDGDGVVEEEEIWYESENIDYGEDNDFYNHDIGFGESSIPANVPLQLKVAVYCEQEYNGEYIYDPADNDIPQAARVQSLFWEDLSPEGTVSTSSTVNNSDLNNITINNIESKLNDPSLNINLLIEDIIGKE